MTKDRLFYTISCKLLWAFLKIVGRIKGIGWNNVPRTGGVIVAPNHISYLDPPAVGVCMKRQVHYMAKEELFKSKFLAKWMYGVGTFPVKRGTADRKAIKHALDLLAQGRVVCVFPEGTRSEDGNLQPAELGIGLIAMKSRCPVVPVAIIGTDKVLPAHGKRVYFHPIKVVYGEPLTFEDLCDGRDSKQAMEEVGRRTMSAIAALLAEHK